MNKEDKRSTLPRKEPNHGTFLGIENVVSATDCTGLMPTPPLSEDEVESYVDIYGITQPLNKVNNHLQHE